MRAAACKALACYKAADLDEAQLLRPLRDYGLLLLEETDESALQQCSELIQSMLQYEHSIRRRYGTSTQAHADLFIIDSESATNTLGLQRMWRAQNNLYNLLRAFECLSKQMLILAHACKFSYLLQKSDSGIGPIMPKQLSDLV